MKATAIAAVLLLAAGVAAAADEPAPAPESCSELAVYHLLDFWLGTWDVSVGGMHVGTDTVSRVAGDCAVEERWRSVTGGVGLSLFWYDQAAAAWKQVWVTSAAFRPGGTKEKVLKETTPDGGLRFEGVVTRPDGSSYRDRTTLTPGPDGTIHQLIEVSDDDGENWKSTFDAVYRRTD